MRTNEIIVGKYFVDWLNANHGHDYTFVPNSIQNSPDDFYVESKTSFPRLNLQIVAAENVRFALARNRKKAAKEGKQNMVVGEMMPHQWIADAIRMKEEKYPPDVKRETVLLIEGTFPTMEPNYVEKEFKGVTTDFKGVYYVALPTNGFMDYENRGYVITLKDIH